MKKRLIRQIVTIVAMTLMFLLFTGKIWPSLVFGGFVFIMWIGTARINSGSYSQSQKAKYAFISDESIFNNSILVLLATVLKADQKKSDVEIAYIRAALSEHFSDVRVASMIAMIQKLMKAQKLHYSTVCRVVRNNYRLNERIQMMHFLVGIVTADGLLTKQERDIIYEIAGKINIPPRLIQSVFKMFNFITEEEVKDRQERKKKETFVTTMYLTKALKILGLNENATVKEIKKAYRKLAMLHHPDRLIHLGEEHQQSAKEKFQAISDAYEYIKLKKGFS